MLLLGIDLESGDNFQVPPKDQFITELGMVLWDTDTRQPVEFFNRILKHPSKTVVDEAADYTGITPQIIERFGVTPGPAVIAEILVMLSKADYIVAHNGIQFDKVVLGEFLASHGKKLPEKVWIDTMIDVPYPRHCKQRNLTYLAGYHRLVNPFAHRAVTDVLIMLTILDMYDIDVVIESAKSPLIVVQAMVSFNDKDDAKKEKFSWERAGNNTYPKAWVKMMKESEYRANAELWPFMSKILEVL